MIVKLRQNFTKMREFSQIRDQKKLMVKTIIVYEIQVRLCYVNATFRRYQYNIGGFQHKLLKLIQSCLVPYKTIRQSTYNAGSWNIFQHTAAFDPCKCTLHFMHMIRVFFWHTLHLSWVVNSEKCPTPSCLKSASAWGLLIGGRAALADSIKPVA